MEGRGDADDSTKFLADCCQQTAVGSLLSSLPGRRANEEDCPQTDGVFIGAESPPSQPVNAPSFWQCVAALVSCCFTLHHDSSLG